MSTYEDEVMSLLMIMFCRMYSVCMMMIIVSTNAYVTLVCCAIFIFSTMPTQRRGFSSIAHKSFIVLNLKGN